MDMIHRKNIFLALLHAYTMSARPCCPGETVRERFHRLVDTTQRTGYKVFERRNDGRHFIANVNIADEKVRVMTVFDNTLTGKLDIDLSNDLSPELQDDVFMMLYEMLMIAFSVTVYELVNHTKTHQSKLALEIAARAAAAI